MLSTARGTYTVTGLMPALRGPRPVASTAVVPFIDTKLEGRIRAALAARDRPGLQKIAEQFGVGTGTVQRIAAV